MGISCTLEFDMAELLSSWGISSILESNLTKEVVKVVKVIKVLEVVGQVVVVWLR